VLAIAFEQAAETTPCMKSVKAEQLHQWLRIFVKTYFEQTNTFIHYRAKLREYLERLKTSCEDVKFVGIDAGAREDHRAARLLDIFVVPNVLKESAKLVSSPERLLLERPEPLTERQAELWLEQRDRFSQERGRSMSAHDMLATTRRRVVLLGDPGTGKTTLMRYLAVKVAEAKGAEIGLPENQERLPILVYMGDWAKHPERSLLDQVRDFAENTLQVDLPTGFLEHWTDGQALLLLDGLDEVAEDATRADLVEKINCFLAAYENNWAVITSRKWGYRRDYFRTEDYPHFELELFNDAQIQEFIEHWYENRCENATQA
jgi:predicted NACHT family NTPase